MKKQFFFIFLSLSALTNCAQAKKTMRLFTAKRAVCAIVLANFARMTFNNYEDERQRSSTSDALLIARASVRTTAQHFNFVGNTLELLLDKKAPSKEEIAKAAQKRFQKFLMLFSFEEEEDKEEIALETDTEQSSQEKPTSSVSTQCPSDTSSSEPETTTGQEKP